MALPIQFTSQFRELSEENENGEPRQEHSALHRLRRSDLQGQSLRLLRRIEGLKRYASSQESL